MGPRPDGRGKAAPAPQDTLRRLGVNGAAARRPRKVNSANQMPSSQSSVNGAAARRPRKATAEDEGRNVDRRQWGRGQTAAESAIRPPFNGGFRRRQWGRGQTAAESGALGATKAESDAGVNGAAARRPRKEPG